MTKREDKSPKEVAADRRRLAEIARFNPDMGKPVGFIQLYIGEGQTMVTFYSAKPPFKAKDLVPGASHLDQQLRYLVLGTVMRETGIEDALKASRE